VKALIVGGGIMGLATAWAMAREGHEVELFEQGPLPNPLASSVDQHRLIRHPYGPHLGYARMIDDAYAAWDLMWTDLGRKFYAPTGTLALSGDGTEWASRSAENLAAIGRPMTELTIAELVARFPMLDAGGVERAFYIDTGGELFAQDIAEALARHLEGKPKVRLHAGALIRSVDLDKAQVTTSVGEVHGGDVVVVAAGARLTRLLPDLGKRVVPSRQVVVYFDLPPDLHAVWAKAPMIIEKTDDVGLYLVPPAGGRGMKVGDHEFSRRGDPDGSRFATVEEMRPLLDRCRRLVRDFDRWRVDRLKVCFYTVADDERFIVEKHGAAGWAMSVCSGHGFKFGALMGLELAKTIASGRDPAGHAKWAAGFVGDGTSDSGG
jgi:glycine/D-amino acid oxidase-like deaminating enzyme